MASLLIVGFYSYKTIDQGLSSSALSRTLVIFVYFI